jgi:predicted small lipoprotein YifL
MRILLIALIIASLGLGACGRKGSLEPPPGAPKQDNSQSREAP